MGIDKPEVLPWKTRLLAIAAGCLSGVIGSLTMGIYFAVYPSVLILGAAAQPRFPRSGRWIMLVGALMLSVVVLPYGAGMMFYGVKTLYRYHDYVRLVVFTLWIVSFVLVTWCDIALAIEAIRGKRARQTGNI